MVDLSSEVLYILLTVNYNSVKEGGFGEEGGGSSIHVFGLSLLSAEIIIKCHWKGI